MKRVIVSLAVLMCIAMPIMGASAVDDQDQESTEVTQAHEHLRDALKTIRELHEGDWPGEHLEFATQNLLTEHVLLDSKRPRLGVVVGVATDAEGAEVLAVTPGGPADEAGLKAEDVITAVNGTTLGADNATGALINAVRELEDGETVTVDYLRDGAQSSVSVTVREMELEHLELAQIMEPHRLRTMIHEAPFQASGWFVPHGWWKVELVSLNPDLGEYFGTESGVLVVRGSDDEALPLRGGDVILSIDGREVQSPTHAMRILRSYAAGENPSIEIMRKGRLETLSVAVPEGGAHLDH